MQICIAFMLIALGGGLYALHTQICRKCEKTAWQNGYIQAQKEEQMRMKAVEQYKAQLRPIIPRGAEERAAVHAQLEEVKRHEVSPDFMDEMRKNGRAVVRLK